MNQMTKLFISLSTILLLSACGTMYSEDFSCSAYPNMGCTPSEHVFHKTHGDLNDYRRSKPSNQEEGTVEGININISNSTKRLSYVVPGDPILTNPKKLRILFFPWKDKDGDFNGGGYVYVRIGEPEWLLLQK